MITSTGATAALAGRRIDPSEADTIRFPLSEAERVGQELKRVFRQEQVHKLFCSAACGADIIALEAAGALGIPARIVLPFHLASFRTTSVVDRPGNWGPRFDRLVTNAVARDDLIELGLSPDNPTAFSLANAEIIAQAQRAGATRWLAIVVWEGRSRGNDDATADFLTLAREQAFTITSISSREA